LCRAVRGGSGRSDQEPPADADSRRREQRAHSADRGGRCADARLGDPGGSGRGTLSRRDHRGSADGARARPDPARPGIARGLSLLCRPVHRHLPARAGSHPGHDAACGAPLNRAMTIHLSPSILAADTTALGAAVSAAAAGVADSLQIDVMDGHYVANYAFSPKTVDDLPRVTDLPLHAHLEVANPD